MLDRTSGRDERDEAVTEASETLELQRYRAHSYFLREGHHAAFLRECATRYSRAQLSVFADNAFALVKPDAVRSGKLRQVLDWLCAQGFSLSYAMPVWTPHERQFEALYKYNLTLRNEQNQIDSWWINKQVYLMGPSVALLLRHAPGAAYERLAAVKGPSDPNRGKAGELRYDLCAANMAMNLFHCSDEPLSSLRELSLFTAREDIPPLLDEVVRTPQATLARIAYASIEKVEAALPAPVDVAPTRVVASVACRTAMAAGFTWPEAETLREVALSRPFPGTPHFSALRRALEPLRSALETRPRNPVEDALLTLASFPDVEDLKLETCLHTLVAYRLELTDWEKLTLQTTAHYRQCFANAL